MYFKFYGFEDYCPIILPDSVIIIQTLYNLLTTKLTARLLYYNRHYYILYWYSMPLLLFSFYYSVL